jgi:methyl coenzyme M reductase subunit C
MAKKEKAEQVKEVVSGVVPRKTAPKKKVGKLVKKAKGKLPRKEKKKAQKAALKRA